MECMIPHPGYRSIDKSGESDIFYLMQKNQALLSKKAIEAALRGNWKEAIELNKQILELNPSDIDTKARLGKAYLQTKDFTKAKKCFKEVLDVDPINSIAKKNYELAKDKVAIKAKTALDAKALVKEPGISTIIDVILLKGTAEDYVYGQELKFRVNKSSVKFVDGSKEVAEYTGTELVKSLHAAKNERIKVETFFAGGNGKSAKLILKAASPVFKAERQVVKPYIKKGTLKEPEIELTEIEEEQE